LTTSNQTSQTSTTTTPPVEGLESTIRQVASGPASASNDAGSATAQNIRDLIEADKYLLNREAARRTGRAGLGIRLARVIPPGAY
jgi:hypothetical protein